MPKVDGGRAERLAPARDGASPPVLGALRWLARQRCAILGPRHDLYAQGEISQMKGVLARRGPEIELREFPDPEPAREGRSWR